MKRIGPPKCQGAVFVYKDDNTRTDAENVLKNFNATFPIPITGELHTNKIEFLGSLKDWNISCDPTNAFLCVYAHMGEPGISCVDHDDGRVITWDEIALTLPEQVQVLWLVGCESQYAMSIWSLGVNPVREFLVATTKSKYFLPLVPLFRYEISMYPVFGFDEMPVVLDYLDRDISSVTEYNKWDGRSFQPYRTTKILTPDLEAKINRI